MAHEAAATESPHVRVDPDACAACAEPLPSPSARFCLACGAAQPRPDPLAPLAPPASNTRLFRVTTWVGLGLVAYGVLVRVLDAQVDGLDGGMFATLVAWGGLSLVVGPVCVLVGGALWLTRTIEQRRKRRRYASLGTLYGVGVDASPMAETRTSPWAIGAFVLGLLVGPLPALICAVMAFSEIRARRDTGGRALAIAGLVVSAGWVLAWFAIGRA